MKLKFHGKVLLSVVVPLALVFTAIAFVLGMQVTGMVEKNLSRFAKAQTVAGSKEISHWLDFFQMWLNNVSNNPELKKTLSKEEVESWLFAHDLKHPAVIALIYSSVDGMSYSLGKGKVSPQNYSDRSYYKKIIIEKSTDFFISETLTSKSTGLPVVVLAHSIKDAQGNLAGMLALSITLTGLSDFTSKVDFADMNSYGWIVDGNGIFIAHPLSKIILNTSLSNADKNGYRGLSPVAPDILKKQSGIAHGIINSENEKVVMIWHAVEDTPGWVFGMSIPQKSFTADTKKILLSLSLIMLAGLVLLLTVLIVVLSKLMSPIAKSVQLAKDIARLDLTASIDQETLNANDEFGELSRAMNGMAQKLRSMISEIKQLSEKVSSSGADLNSASRIISQGSTQQAATLEEIAASIMEMAGSIKSNANNSHVTEKIANESAQAADQGSHAVLDTVQSMKQIADKVSIIQEIAGQTRLLSLNASIEAARAGEAGKGFSVVASEVSKLAELSAHAATQIEGLTGTSVQVANEAGKKLQELVPKIKETAQLVARISLASREQESAVEQINVSVREVNTVVQNNAGQSETLASSANASSEYATRLQNIIDQFKF